MLLADNLEQRIIMKNRTTKGNAFALTNIGKVRMTNEDQALTLISSNGYRLLCVCDGMGGHKKGDYASKLAVDILTEEFNKISIILSPLGAYNWVHRVIKMINTEIYNEAQSSETYNGMGTTIVLAFLFNNKIIVANMGDSRMYLIKKDCIEQVTQDQTYVDYMVRLGKMTEEEAQTSEKRHVLMNALGIYASPSIDMQIINNNGFPILLCSDGLYNNSSEKEIFATLSTSETPQQKVDSLIRIANSNGGSDNIAVAYWEAIK